MVITQHSLPTVAQMIESTVLKGIKAARATLSPNFTSKGGVSKPKTRTQLIQDAERLEAIVDVLDGMMWYGEWGITPWGIKTELINRAKIGLHSERVARS